MAQTAQSDDVRRRSPDPESLTPSAARALVLRWLGQRELSSTELRGRLRRRHFPDTIIDATLAALAADGLVDDRRAALARARHDATIKRHGRGRVQRRVEALGVDRDTAQSAVREVFADLDEDQLLDDALTRRLRGQPVPTDRRAAAKLFAWLVRQGFDAGKVSGLLRARARRDASPD